MPTVTEIKDNFNAQVAPLADEFRTRSANLTQRQYTIAVAIWYGLGALIGILFGPVWAVAVLPLLVLAQIVKYVGANKRETTPVSASKSRRI